MLWNIYIYIYIYIYINKKKQEQKKVAQNHCYNKGSKEKVKQYYEDKEVVYQKALEIDTKYYLIKKKYRKELYENINIGTCLKNTD